MTVFIYMRVSTDKQEESGLGLEAQRHACMQWIEKNAIQGDVREFIDIVTGTDKKRKELEERPKLLEALSLLMPGDVFIVSKRDRLGRDPYVNCMIERIIEKKKAKLCCADGQLDGDEPHNILMRRILDAFAEYEALMISTRTKAALSRKKARGERMGHIPYGHNLDATGKLAINANEAKILKVMHTYRTRDKLTFREIANRLNRAGYSNRQGQPWNHGSTSRVWSNYPLVSSCP